MMKRLLFRIVLAFAVLAGAQLHAGLTFSSTPSRVSDLSVTAAGTLDETGDSVLVESDRGYSAAATLSGNTWSASVQLEPGTNTLTAHAVKAGVIISSAATQVVSDARSSVAPGSAALPAVTSGGTLNLVLTTRVPWESRSGYTLEWQPVAGEIADLGMVNVSGSLAFRATYTAPQVSTETEFTLTVYITQNTGPSKLRGEKEYSIRVVPDASVATAARAGGQVSVWYDASAPQPLLVNYTANASTSQARFLVSYDALAWTDLSIVKAGGTSGSFTCAPAGLATNRRVWVRMMCEAVTGALAGTVDSRVLEYTPPEAVVAKSTEIPAAPVLLYLGTETDKSEVTLSWHKVIDSRFADNATHYEVQWWPTGENDRAQTVNVGNPSTGPYRYETLNYKVTGLANQTYWWFRVRAVNNVGTGPWSDPVCILTNIFVPPSVVLTSPANGATGVSKEPLLEWEGTGANLDYSILFGTTPSSLNVIRAFKKNGYVGVPRLDYAKEWGLSLLPGATYYWQVRVTCVGKDETAYGGLYPVSPVWSFTTANTGFALEFSNPVALTPVKPSGDLSFRITVKNTGTEPSRSNYIKAAYQKGGTETEFSLVSGGLIEPLAPGASRDVTVTVRFRDSLLTDPSGTVYDNILVTGNSSIRFHLWHPDEQHIGSLPSLVVPIAYANSGGPVVSRFDITSRGTVLSAGTLQVVQGAPLQVASWARDDVRIAGATVWYRTSPTGSWIELVRFTNAPSAYCDLGRATMSTPSIGTISEVVQGGFVWTLPQTFPVTSAMQVRLQYVDNEGVVSPMQESAAFRVLSGQLSATLGTPSQAKYLLGETVRVPLRISAGNPITLITAKLYCGARTVDIPSMSGDSVKPPPEILSFILPKDDALAHSHAYVSVRITDAAGTTIWVTSSDIVIEAPPVLPSPYGKRITTFEAFNFPKTATGTSEDIQTKGVAFSDVSSQVHILTAHDYSYTLASVSNSSAKVWHRTVDMTSGALGALAEVPGEGAIVAFTVFNGTPYVLRSVGERRLFLYKRAGSTFDGGTEIDAGRPADWLFFMQSPTLFVRGGELHASWFEPNASTYRCAKLTPTVAPSTIAFSSSQGDIHRFQGDYLVTRQGAVHHLNADATYDNQVGALAGIGADEPVLRGRALVHNRNPGVLCVAPLQDGSISRLNSDLSSVATVPPVLPDHVTLTPEMLIVGGKRGDTLALSKAGPDGAAALVFPLGSNDSGYSSAHFDTHVSGKVACAWGRYLSIGDFSKDLNAPTLTVAETPGTYVAKVPQTLAWTVEDNKGVTSLEVIKLCKGLSTTLATYSSAIPSTYTYAFDDTADELTLRVVAKDGDGNYAAEERLFVRSTPVTISDFSVDKTAIALGDTLTFSWTTNLDDARRSYSIERISNAFGSTWTPVVTVTGRTTTNVTVTDVVGPCQYRLVTGTSTQSLGAPVVVTGELLEFVDETIQPSGAWFRPSGQNWVPLQWQTNHSGRTSVEFTVLAKKEGEADFSAVGNTVAETLQFDPGAATTFTWKVRTRWAGVELESLPKLVELRPLVPPTLDSATAEGLATDNPSVKLAYTPITGVAAYEVSRTSGGGSAVVVGRADGSGTFIDTTVSFGTTYTYRLASMASGSASGYCNPLTVTVASAGVSEIRIVTANGLRLQGNSLALEYAPAVAGECYERYEIVLGTSAENLSSWGTTAGRSFPLTGLRFGTTYIVGVHALDHLGRRITPVPATISFTTGFDERPIGAVPAPTVSDISADHVVLTWQPVPNADSYRVYRKTNAGEYEWIGSVTGTTFVDQGGILPRSTYQYQIMAANGNSVAWSSASPAASIPSFPGAVTDLKVVSTAATSVGLSWTVPVGEVTSYDLRRAGSAITAENWAQATRIEGEPVATPAYSRQTMTVDGLAPGSVFLFALVAVDGAGKQSALSNQVIAVTLNAAETGILPLITAQPESLLLSEGTRATFAVNAVGDAPLGYQWYKDGMAIAGATSTSLTLAAAAVGDAGEYSCVVANTHGSTTSDLATLTVLPTGTSATHEVVGGGYTPGGTVTISTTIHFAGQSSALGWQVLLPSGWSYASASGDVGDMRPRPGDTEFAEWSWTTVPVSPLRFSYTLKVPQGTTGDRTVQALAILRLEGVPGPLVFLAKPAPLTISSLNTHHTADTDRNGRLSLQELTRVIQLYNTRYGTTRTGCYKVDDAGEDGFAPDSSRQPSDTVTLPRRHSADTQTDGQISLTELTRVIELYNTRSGSTRTGAYHVEHGTEDGFAPGP